jgi:5-methylcytosine-specific restriction protein A
VKQLGLFAGIPTPVSSWNRLREQVLREEPACQICEKAPSTHIHHKVPVTLGGTNARSNLEGLCQDCHSVLPV